MDAIALLREARAAGVSVELDGDQLHVVAPAKHEQWIERLREQKQAVVAVLSGAAIVEPPIISTPHASVEITTAEHENIAAAIAALARDPSVFQRGGQLVDVVRDSTPKRRGILPSESPRIVALPLARLRTKLCSNIRFFRTAETENGIQEVAVHPPDWIVKGVAADGRWPDVRHLEAVVTSPILLDDGSILQRPGYDPTTGILYEPSVDYPAIPSSPTAAEIRAAVDSLLDVVADFPFDGDEHKAAWLAATLTPLARFAFHGPAPLFLIDANTRGAGKGLLVDCCGIIATGCGMATASYTRDDDEMRKVITSIAIAGEQMVFLDNIAGTLGNASLDAALTSTKWKGRVLGSSQTIELPLVVTWFATGNNVCLGADTARRVCHIRLNSPEERPEEREGFTHLDLRAWVRGERVRLLTAALTLLRGYVDAGRPDMGLKPWGSFEAWSGLVRNCVVWAGLPDPGATRNELVNQADTDVAHLRSLLAGWQEIDQQNNGLTVAEVFDRVEAGGYPAMSSALAESCTGRKGERPTARVLGYKLRQFRKRVIGGLCFESGGESRTGSIIWRVVGSDAGDAGDAGDVFPNAGKLRTHAHAHARVAETSSASPASPASPDLTANGHCNCGGKFRDEAPANGQIRTSCPECGRFYGYRPVEAVR